MAFDAQNMSNPAAVLGQVDQLRQAGRLTEAENLCRMLVAAQPNSPIALNALGLIRRIRGDQAEAESLMRKAIAAAPREPALHNNLGNILLARGDIEGAEAAYRKAIALKPDYPEACYNLGIALRDQGRSDEALAAQRRAASLRPNYAQALVQQGVLLTERGHAQDALAPLEAAAKADPRLYDAHYYRGTALIDLERFEEAIPSLQSAVDIAPNRHEARYAVAKAFAHVGREDDALRAYQTVFERKPDFLPALQDFTSLAWSMGNGAKSLSAFEHARSKVGETPDLLLAEANLRLRFSGDISIPAESMLRRARDMAPERADITNALARALVLQGRLEQSFPMFQEAIKSEPEAVRHRQDFGEALLSHGEFAEARTVYQDALTLDAYDQITLAGLTLAYRELGDSRYGELVDFDRFVRVYEIAPPPGFSDLAAFNRMLAEELERLHTRHAPPLDQTLRNGTQTAGSLFKQNSRAIEAVREQISAAIADYIASMPDDANHPLLARKQKDFAFSGSWSCRLRSTGYHTNHVHDQGWISSAYYASLPQEVAEGGQGGLKFGESRFKLGGNDRPARIVPPAVGKLALFPSYFWHGTVPFQSSDVRLSIAFDVTPGSTPPRRPLLAKY
ncbi:MAG TPA: tetratricopeptide repeat protein [Rhizomicrobium sp.]|nr:tetratricopeptide repeat protein [Rhizomicrobium sp.]